MGMGAGDVYRHRPVVRRAFCFSQINDKLTKSTGMRGNNVNQIQIGHSIWERRKRMGITQQTLARHLGVSKAAVSKWESGQSFPDITLLPVLAAFFNCTVDALIHYEPQMDREQIRKTYARLSSVFAHEGFADGMAQSRALVKQYYACWPLLLHMAILWVNNIPSAPDTQAMQRTLEEANELLMRVEAHSTQGHIIQQAVYLRGTIYLLQEQPEKAEQLLEDKLTLPLSAELLLAMAKMRRGDYAHAETLMQGEVYKGVTGLLSTLVHLLQLPHTRPDKRKAWERAADQLIEAFDADTLHPLMTLPIYATLAQLAMQDGQEQEALKHLQRYTDVLCMPGTFPLRLRGNALLDRVNALFDTFDLGTALPRDEGLIRQSMAEVYTAPFFASLRTDAQFQLMQRRAAAAIAQARDDAKTSAKCNSQPRYGKAEEEGTGRCR